ncbi:putative alpha-L-fucosidase [Helianthus annuus]|nr:putative alpha-L-fucosidase [Helianthus annuus]
MESFVKVTVIWMLALFILAMTEGEKLGSLPRCSWAGIYNFGDSNSDTGGISAAFIPVTSPYGMTFFNKPVGRLTDGRLLLDFLVEYIGLPYVSAYLDTINTDYRHGANFATGGSTIRKQNESIYQGGISPFSLDIQTIQFTQFNQLYGQGARSFWIHNTGPVGCLPVATFNVKNPKPGYLDQYGCIRYQNDIAMEFNKQLKARVIKLRSQLADAAITYVDIYTAKYKLISNTKKYGFKDHLKVCCGHHENDVHIFCGKTGIVNGTKVFGGACANPETYVSWDAVHMTEAANRWVANHVLNGSLSDPPIPATHACYNHL